MYRCKYCGREFENRYKLNGHCTYCEERTGQKVQHVCDYCGKVIVGDERYKKHKMLCKQNPNKINTSHENARPCQFCGKECKNDNSLRNHERLCKQNPNKAPSNLPSQKGKTPWNKGLTKESNQSMQKNAQGVKKYYLTHEGTFKGKHHTDEAKKKIANAQNALDRSDNPRRSHGKSGWYDGIFMMSRYEIAYYIFTKDQGNKIERCKQSFYYEWEGKTHKYTPDFIVDGTLVELKGYETPVDLAKYKVVPGLVVLYEKDIKHCFEYVKTTYNVDDVKDLYQNRPIA